MNLPKGSCLFEVIAALETKEECQRLMTELLTSAEYEEVPKRWQIMVLRMQGLTYEEIIDRLKTSNQTISRGAHTLEKPGSFCRLIIEKFNLVL
jgi:uncharacterized protein YerC